MRSELLQFGLEQSVLLACDGFLVEHDHVRDVVAVNLSYFVSTVQVRAPYDRSSPSPSDL